MPFFALSLWDGDAVLETLGLLEFDDLEEARLDVAAAVPDTAADLVRQGVDPLGCRFRIGDEDDGWLLDVPLAAVLRRESGTERPGAAVADPSVMSGR